MTRSRPSIFYGSISAFFPAARNENRGQLGASRPFRAILARERTWLGQSGPRSSRTPSARSVAGALWRGRLVITGATRIIRSIDPGRLGRSRSSQASATFGSAIGCRHAIAVPVDSLLEGDGFEPPVPRQIGNGFEASSKSSRSTIGATVSSEQTQPPHDAAPVAPHLGRNGLNLTMPSPSAVPPGWSPPLPRPVAPRSAGSTTSCPVGDHRSHSHYSIN